MENSGESGDDVPQGNFFQASGASSNYISVHSDDLEGK